MSKIVTYQEQALEQRRQEALKVAQRCIQLLKQEFGATDLWSGSLLLELDEYRKFRHLSRHIYNIELKPERVLTLARNVQTVLPKVKQAIALFNEWLVSREQK